MEFLKSIFGDKALTFEQFSTAVTADKSIKIGNLASGEYVAKGKLDAADQKATGLQKQLDDANAAIAQFKNVDVEGLKGKASEWENKYNTDTAALKQQLADTEYNQTVKSAVTDMKFTSASAKKAFIADLTAKKLQVTDGKLLGLDDFTKSYKESDPSAFSSEDDGKNPMFAKNTTTQSGGVSPDAALRAAFGLPLNDKKE